MGCGCRVSGRIKTADSLSISKLHNYYHYLIPGSLGPVGLAAKTWADF